MKVARSLAQDPYRHSRSIRRRLKPSSRLLKLGIAASAVALIAWTDQQVGIKVAHIGQWGSGTLEDPLVVTRDNPWLEGWFSAGAGEWASATGTYSHVYDGSCIQALAVTEFGGAGYLDKWVTPGRPPEGYQQTGVRYGTDWLGWAARTGNLVPGNTYAAFQINTCAGQSASSTYFKLATDVIVVPVIVFGWIIPELGGEAWQDYRARGRANFDYIPFKGNHVTTAPSGWIPPASDDPTVDFDAPDDIWSQCGIQLQVVRTVKGYTNEALNYPDCEENSLHRLYADLTGVSYSHDSAKLAALQAEYPNNPEVAQQLYGLLNELQPLIVDFGFAGCPYFYGKTDWQSSLVQIDNGGAPRNVVAHEIAHALTHDTTHHPEPNLLCAGYCDGTVLTPEQCATARTHALDFANRFRTYNEKIGRIPHSNPLTPTYPADQDPGSASMEQSCCSFEDTVSWMPAAACLSAAGGNVVPDYDCTECCLLSLSPAEVRWMGPGQCPPNAVVKNDLCKTVCCSTASGYEELALAECNGPPVNGQAVAKSLCGVR